MAVLLLHGDEEWPSSFYAGESLRGGVLFIVCIAVAPRQYSQEAVGCFVFPK